ncbi:glycosyltransferase [Staphylococcus xylosus]|uniref:Glycosyltransferase n=2 Tax=Staphylococcus xylosus TaxID=1288 RepID=A0A418IJK4_STAXY|nr:glycosyltransferase [Staphylococcus xylosus]RIN06090.1 glycosyltransferase [Staphylococcus xylosus]
MIYTVTSTLPPVHGGRTKSLLGRTKFLDEELGLPSTILTTNYNPNYNDVYESFFKEEKVTENIKYENIYDWLANYELLTSPRSKILKKIKYIETPLEMNDLKYKFGKTNNIVRYYDSDDSYVLYRRYFKDSNILEFEDFMSPISKKRIQRWQYNNYGVLHKKIYYSPNSYKKIAEEFFDANEIIYCKKFFEDNDANNVIQIQTYKDDRPHKTFKTEKQLFQYYFDNKFSENDTVFCDARLLDKPLLNKKINTKNILAFHSSHMNADKVEQSYKFALENHHKVSKYLLLTNKQKNDIQNVSNISSEKISVIPHFINSNPYSNNVVKEDRFVFIGRIAEEKQIDHILKAYSKFLESGYNTSLDIYGRGEFGQVSVIENLIFDLGIQNKVHIHGFTNDPSYEFQKSKASLLTSSFEGFGLSVMESINVGCPVISYDVKYGPSEIINHGKNGYLVEKNNIEQLTKYMIDIIENPLTNVKTKPELTFDSAKNNYKQLFSSIGYNL